MELVESPRKWEWKLRHIKLIFIKRRISYVNREEELERAIALVPRKKSNGEPNGGPDDNDDYDPHLHRKVPHPTS